MPTFSTILGVTNSSAVNSLKPILRPRVIFLDRVQKEAEIVGEKVLLSVPPGEP